jgi:hypothetical protein
VLVSDAEITGVVGQEPSGGKRHFAQELFTAISMPPIRATVSVTASLVDPTTAAVPYAYLEFDLQKCGYNIPQVPGTPLKLRDDPSLRG